MQAKRSNRTLQMPGESWLPIAGFPGYEVSDHGRVKNIGGPFPWICALATKKGGYKLAMLRRDGATSAQNVHRLVALAFIPNPESLPVVHHKDATPSNNRATNLQWTTQKENIRLAMLARGNWLLGSNGSRRKIIRIDPTSGEIKSFPSVLDAARALNVLTVANGGISRNVRSMAPNICSARDSKRTAYGFYWRTRRSKFTAAIQSASKG